MKIIGFNWDDHNETKCQKHGLSIQDIEGFFLEEPSISADDKHSETEDRFVAFGSYKSRYIVAVFTLRVYEGRLTIRVISARYAHKKEMEALNEKEKEKRKKTK